ncbi:MAG: hypothetical protein ABIQ40_11620 [Bacteroidia bacterium]
MKKYSVFLILLFFCLNLSAKQYMLQKPNSIPTLELSFKLTDEGKRVTNYYLLIYCDTNAADTLFIQKGKVSYLYLRYNHNYTLRYVKQGYRDRVLIVRTDFANRKNMQFDYEIELVKENELANTFADLPVAIIRYDLNKKRFDYSRTYHKQVRQKFSARKKN